MKTLSKITTDGGYGHFEIHLEADMPDGLLESLTESERWKFHRKTEEILELLYGFSTKRDLKIQLRVQEEKIKITGLLPDIRFKTIPNGYMEKDPYFQNFPWFVFGTKIGAITVGWRKRVLVIDWEGTLCEESAEDLFPNENTTKFGRLIHAWSYEEAKEYLNRILA